MLLFLQIQEVKILIFEKEKVAINILDVLKLNQSNVSIGNSERNFDALSYRYDSNTVIQTKKETIKLKSGSVCYVPARIDYLREASKENLIVIHFNSLNYFSKEIEYFYPKNQEKISGLFKQVLEVWNNKEIGYKHICSSLFYNIFAEIYKEMHISDKNNSKIEKSVKYISEFFKDSNISVKKAAKISNISEVYFRKLFKEEFGISPKKHIINLRIKYAVSLIESGYYSLKEIAFMSGFTDYKYFSTEFHKIIGIPPSKYYYNYTDV